MRTRIFISLRIWALHAVVFSALALTLAWRDIVSHPGGLFYLLVFSPCLVAAGCTAAFVLASLWAIAGAFARRKPQCHGTRKRAVYESLLLSFTLGTTVATTVVLIQEPRMQWLISIVGGPVVAWFGVCAASSLLAYSACGSSRLNSPDVETSQERGRPNPVPRE